MITQEFARNPYPEVRIACPKCRKESVLEKVLKERPVMQPPYETVIETYRLCPFCGAEETVYYMSENLRFRQREMKKQLDRWHSTKDSAAWRKYALLQKNFQERFDETQKRYRELFAKVTT